jgi:DHA2 family multidrug resistance protein
MARWSGDARARPLIRTDTTYLVYYSDVGTRKGGVLDTRHLFGLLGALIAAIAVEFNDQVVTVALPDIKGSLGISNDPGTWLISLFATGQVIGMAFSTSLAVGFTIRRFALFAFALCTCTSLAIPGCANLGLMFVLRFLQGLSGGFVIPLLLTTGLRVLTPETRLYALAAYALTATFGPNISPTLAALWDDVLNWRFVFFEDLPLFTIAFLLVWYGLPQDEPQFARLKKFDWRGGILIVISAFSLVTLLEQGNRLDWFNSRFICVLALTSAVSIPLFIFNELKTEIPLFGIWLLKRRNFAYGAIALFMFLIVSQSGAALPDTFLQVAGYRPHQIYPLSLELAVVEVLTLPLLALLLNRSWVDPRIVSTIGLLLIITADIEESTLTSVWVARDFLIWDALQAVGQPMFIMPLLMMATNTIRDPKDGPFGSAMVNSTRAIAEPVGLWLVQLIMRWRGALHSDRITDQMGQTRFSVIQALGLIPGNPPPLLPNGTARTAGSLNALHAALRGQVAVMSLSDAFLVFAMVTASLLILVWLVAERTYPPRIALKLKDRA